MRPPKVCVDNFLFFLYKGGVGGNFLLFLAKYQFEYHSEYQFRKYPYNNLSATR